MNGKTKRVKFKDKDTEACPTELSELIKRPECYFNLGLKDGRQPRPTPDTPIPVVPIIPPPPEVIGLPLYGSGIPPLKQDMTNYNHIPRAIASDVAVARKTIARPKKFMGRDIVENIDRRYMLNADGRIIYRPTPTSNPNDLTTDGHRTITPRTPPEDTGAGAIPRDTPPPLDRFPSLGIRFTNVGEPRVPATAPDITPPRGRTTFARLREEISPIIRGLSQPKFLQFDAVQEVLQRFRTEYLPGDTRDLKPVELAKIVRSYYEDLKTNPQGELIKTDLTARQRTRLIKEIKTGIRVHLMNVDVDEADIRDFINSEERRIKRMRIQENRDFIQEQRDSGITITNNSGKALEEDEKIMSKIRRMISRGDRELTIGRRGEVSRGGSSGTELEDLSQRRGRRYMPLTEPPPDAPPSPPSGSRRYNPLDDEFVDIDLDEPADTTPRRGSRRYNRLALTDPDEEGGRRRRIQRETEQRRARARIEPTPRRGFMPSMRGAYTRLVQQELDIGTELTNIRDLVSSTDAPTIAPDDPTRVADITSRTRDMGLGDHIRIGADGTATIDADTFRTTPNTADLDSVRNDPTFNQPVLNNDRLTMEERRALARQSIQNIRERPITELGATSAGALGGIGIGYGVSELMASQGANIYANAFTSGAVGDAGGRIVGRATEQAMVRAGLLEAEEITALTATSLARGALEGGAIGLALLPVDMMLNHYLTNDLHMSHLDANVISGTTVGLAATGAMGLTALALAPETFGTSIAVGLLATGVGSLIGAFTGGAEDRREREQRQAEELARQQRQEAIDAINNTNRQNTARQELLASLPQYDYDFNRAWTAFDNKQDLGMGEGDYAEFIMGYGAIFRDEPTTSPITPTDPATQTPEQVQMNQLISQHILHNLIERICSDPGGCNPSLRAQQPPELTQEQINMLDEQTAGTWRGQADVSIEGSYQEMHHTTAVIHDAQQGVIDEWNNNGRTLEEIRELDPAMYRHATNDPTFEARFTQQIIHDSQRQIVDAYYTDLTKMEELDEVIVDMANRDETFRPAMEEFYNGMEASASALGISVPQLMELQVIPDNTRIELPVDPGRRQYEALRRQEGLIRQQERYIEMLQENSENPDVDNDAVYQEARRRLQAYNQNVIDMVAGLNQENQAYIDNYNANINQATNVYGADYADIVNRYNEMQGYFGRDDLLSFNSNKLYTNNRTDAPDLYNPTAKPNPPLPNDTNVINPSPQMNYVNYYDIINYVSNIDGYNQLSQQGKRDIFEFYANNLNALPRHITDGKDIPTDQQKGRLAPVERQLVQSFQERDDTEPTAPAPAPAPATQPILTQATIQLPQGSATIAPTT
jgi:hypothetical protein